MSLLPHISMVRAVVLTSKGAQHLKFDHNREETMSIPINIVYFGIILSLIFFQPVTAITADQDAGEKFYFELEAGPVWQSNNDVQLPGDNGSRFSFKNLTGSGPFAAGRATIGWDISPRHGLKFVFAPLRITGSGSFDREVSFAGDEFAADTSTDGSYKFDTYRLTYRYMFFNKSSWRLRAGGTVLIRDAKIELQQDDVKASDSNVGVVPLLSLSAEWLFKDHWSAIFDFDGLAGGPGRAFDVAFKLQYDLTDRWQIGAGYRTLEGGADNDTVYNFAWFHYTFISAGYRF